MKFNIDYFDPKEEAIFESENNNCTNIQSLAMTSIQLFMHSYAGMHIGNKFFNTRRKINVDCNNECPNEMILPGFYNVDKTSLNITFCRPQRPLEETSAFALVAIATSRPCMTTCSTNTRTSLTSLGSSMH